MEMRLTQPRRPVSGWMTALLAGLGCLATLMSAQAKPANPAGWKAFADCAAAYRVNALVPDPERSASMKSMISDTANDYQKAAETRYRKSAKASAAATHQTIESYIAKRTKAFAPKPRADTEKFIDACPQTDE
jgi:hypothetical protein